MDINLKTQLAAWCDISGHVSKVAVRISINKNTKAGDWFYTSEEYYDKNEGKFGRTLDAIIADLELILAENIKP